MADNDLRVVSLAHAPDLDSSGRIAAALLAALGKRDDVRGTVRSATVATVLATTWLLAHQTRLVIVTACQHISPTALAALADMVTPTTATLLLAVDAGYGDQIRHQVQHLAPVSVAWPKDLGERDEDSNSGKGTAESEERTRMHSWPLPHSAYWTFLADCRRQLLPKTFQQVETVYLDTYLRLGSWLEQAGAHDREFSANQAGQCLRTLIDEQSRYDRVQVVIRAAQAAFHVHGWFLGIDDEQLRHGLLRFPPIRFDDDLFPLLRGLKKPSRAAATALYMCGASPSAIGAVAIEDVAQWRHDPAHPIAGIEVPYAAAPYLRAHLINRLDDAPDSHEPAFTGDARRIATDITQAATDLGLNLGEANLTRDKSVYERRLPGAVLQLERLQHCAKATNVR